MADESGILELRRGLGMSAATDRQRWLQLAGHFYLREFAAAAAGFERWTRDHPSDFFAWLHLAMATFQEGRIESASKALKEAERLHPHDPWVEWLRAEVLLALEDPTGAREVVDRRKTAWLRQPALLLRGGDLLRRLGEVEGGEDWIQRAIEEIGDPAAGNWLRQEPPDEGLPHFTPDSRKLPVNNSNSVP